MFPVQKKQVEQTVIVDMPQPTRYLRLCPKYSSDLRCETFINTVLTQSEGEGESEWGFVDGFAV